MQELDFLYRQAREIILEAIPSYWKEMRLLCFDMTDEKMLPELITPAICCKAVGGRMSDTHDICAAILAAEVSVRVLDDLEDKDKSNALFRQIGVARTLNYIDAFRTVAFKILSNKCAVDARYLKIMQAFTDCYLVVLAGQDRDLKSQSISWDDTWKTIEMKTGYIYATTAAMGAIAGTDNDTWIEACKKYGYHLGLAIQIFNDMDGIWSPEGNSDLEQGKVTLPLVYGLHCNDNARQALLEIVQQNRIAENAKYIKEILDQVDAKSYLIWAALKQRESGLQAITILPDNTGKEILEAHFTGMFGDIDQLLSSDHNLNNRIEAGFENIHEAAQPGVLHTTTSTQDSTSDTLNLRRKLRTEFT